MMIKQSTLDDREKYFFMIYVVKGTYSYSFGGGNSTSHRCSLATLVFND
jgi:hypothetical protein